MADSGFQSEQSAEMCANSRREYVVFGESYNEDIVEIVQIREDAGRLEIDRRPFTPDYVKAVVTIDNQVVPVVDVRDMIMLPKGGAL